jgi:Domain of unknown function (DUF4157)
VTKTHLEPRERAEPRQRLRPATPARAPATALAPAHAPGRPTLGGELANALVQRQAAAAPSAPAAATPSALRAGRTYRVVVVGSPGRKEVDVGHGLQFAQAAAQLGPRGDDVVWLVERTGYDAGGIPASDVVALAGAAHVIWVTPETPLSARLREFPHGSIASLDAYSHGLPGLLALRYGTASANYGLSTEDARGLSPDAFAPEARISFDSCNTGTGGEESLAQVFAEQTNRPVTAWTGRTSYAETNRPDEYGNPQIRGSQVFPEHGSTDWGELLSRVRGQDPHRATFVPHHSPGDFSSFFTIKARLPRTRTFPVAAGGRVSVRIYATSEYTDIQGSPVTVLLHRETSSWFGDDDVGEHRVAIGKGETEFSWTVSEGGTYYLEIFTAAFGYEVEGELSVHIEGARAPVQRTAGAPGAGAADAGVRLAAARGGGSALPEDVRGEMESRFGADFAGVRVHDGPDADSLARTFGAVAFTTGSDIFMRAGAFDPAAGDGRRLLAHELAHVLQQAAGPVDGVPGPGGTLVSEPSDRFERAADRAADAAVAESPAPGSARAIQRQAAEEADPEIEALDLGPKAKPAAQKLKGKHPGITFTSGRRTVPQQAHAMASNIVTRGNRKWIANTYYDFSGTRALQKWVDDHPEATTVDALAKGLEEALDGLTEAQRRGVSHHLEGEAFDVQPQTADAAAITADMKALGGKFLEREDDLVRWHVQFKRRP